MKIEIKEKKENPLLSRTEVSGVVIFQGVTPSNEKMAQSIASQLKVDTSVVKMKNIYTGFGEQKAKFLAFVYKSKEELDRIEPKPKKQLEKEKKKAEAAKKPAEAPKEEAKPEKKPAEAKPEEKKAEAKPEKKKKEAKPEAKEAPKEDKKEGAE